jgi:hypothetical protein
LREKSGQGGFRVGHETLCWFDDRAQPMVVHGGVANAEEAEGSC